MAETTYTVEYAKSARAGCKGPKAVCEVVDTDRKIQKGELRLGTSFTAANGNPSTSWKHWRCVSGKVLENIGSVDRLEGFDALELEDQEKVKKTLEEHQNPDFEEAEAKVAEKKAAGKAEKNKEKEAAKAAAKAEKEAAKAAKVAEKDQGKGKGKKRGGKAKAKSTDEDEEEQEEGEGEADEKVDAVEEEEEEEEEEPPKKVAKKEKAAAAAGKKGKGKAKAKPAKEESEEEEQEEDDE